MSTADKRAPFTPAINNSADLIRRPVMNAGVNGVWGDCDLIILTKFAGCEKHMWSSQVSLSDQENIKK